MPKRYKLDDLDRKILEILSTNGKISNIELAQAIGISPSPCLRRVRLLEDHKYIKGYYADINFNSLGYELVFFISINISVQQEAQKEEFEEALVKVKEVLEIYTLNSGTDYLLKMVVKNYFDYKLVVNSVLAQLPYVKNIRTTKILSVLKSEHYIK